MVEVAIMNPCLGEPLEDDIRLPNEPTAESAAAAVSDLAQLDGHTILCRFRESGNPEDFRLLFEEYRGEITRFVSKKIRDPGTVDDIVQLTFVRLFEACEQYAGNSPRPYLYKIAANLLSDHFRRLARGHLCFETDFDGSAKTSVTPDGDGVLEEVIEGRQSVVEELLRREESQDVMQALEGLHCDERALLHLWSNGESYQSLAALFSVPMGTIRSRLNRVKQQFSEIFCENIRLDAA